MSGRSILTKRKGNKARIKNDMTYKIKMTTEPDREVEAMRLGIDHRVMVTLRDLTLEDASLVAKLVSQLDAKRKGKLI